jgi:hypothetical protein
MMRNRGIRRVAVTIAAVLIFGYAAFEARGMLRGPIIVIEDPLSGATITEGLIRITGYAKNVQSITMNDRTIFLSEEGRIKEPVALLEGYNELVFKGTDRFGKSKRLELVLVYTPTEDIVPGRPSPTAATSSATGTE